MDFVQDICKNKGEVYIVGGANRNYIYNLYHDKNEKIKDYDILVRLLDEDKLLKILKKHGHVKEVGKSFGVLLLTINKINYEIALPRTEISTGVKYRDFIITPKCDLSLKDDFSRRDATINAIAYQIYSINDLKKYDDKEIKIEEFIDPYDGIIDVKNKIWKCIGDAKKRFNEDPNRITRAFRQCSEFDLNIDELTFMAIKENYNLLNELIPESYVRLFNELFKTINGKCGKKWLKIMNDIGILKFLGITTNNVDIDLISPENKIIVNFAILIRPDKMKENLKKWLISKQITATNCMTAVDINTCVCLQNYGDDFMLINNKYDLLKIIEKIYKECKNNVLDIACNMNKYYFETKNIDIKKYDDICVYLEESKKYPQSIDMIKLNGKIMMDRWGLVGNQIKNLKDKLLDKIYRDELNNDLDELTDWCSSNVTN